MPVDVSMYKVPAAPEAPNLLGMMQQATAIRANSALAATRERELAEADALGRVMQSARTPDGKFDMGRVSEALLTNPLTAAKAPDFLAKAVQISGARQDLVAKQLAAAGQRQGLIGSVATGALEHRVQLPDGSWGLDMSHVHTGLAHLSNASPELRPQIKNIVARLHSMTPQERYKAVEQAAYQGLSVKEGIDRLGGNLKLIPTAEGDIVGFDTKRPDKLGKVLYKGEPKPIPVNVNQRLVKPGTGEVIVEADSSQRQRPLHNVPPDNTVLNPQGEVVYQAPARDRARELHKQALQRAGASEEFAEGLSSGRLVKAQHPNGQSYIFDTVSQQSYTPQTSSGKVETRFPAVGSAEEPLPESSLPRRGTNYPGATGMHGVLTNLANQAAGVVGGRPYPQEGSATEALTNLAVRTRAFLTEGVPGRPTNYLMQQLDRLAVNPNEWGMGSARAKERLEQTRDMVKTEVQRIENDVIAAPQNYTKQQISQAKTARSQLRGLLSDYENVLGMWSKGRDPLSPLGEAISGSVRSTGDKYTPVAPAASAPAFTGMPTRQELMDELKRRARGGG